MKAGTRVKVSGLQSRPELNGKQGVAQFYAPTAGKQGRYLVTIDGTNEKLGIKLENLKPLVHNEERSGDKDGLGETITVNGLMYCAEHRMEICGACCFNFRIGNRMSQLQPGDDLQDRAFKVDEEEAARDEPPLRAPTRSAEPSSAPVVLNSKAKPARGIDPSALPAWPRTVQRSSPTGSGARGPLEAAFMNVFSVKEKMVSHTACRPSPADNPLYHVKESMLAMAQRVEEHIEEKKPFPRFILQDDAQTEAIMIDVIDIRVAKPAAGGMEEAVPALVVRYWYCTASNMRKMVKNMEKAMRMKVASDVEMGFSESASRNLGMQNMPSHLLEIKTARAILEENHARLDPTFVASASKGLVADWRVSILQPVPKQGEKTTAVIKEMCALCGKEEEAGGAPLKACARCKVQKYCSKECQKADWKMHKKTCVAPEAAAEAEIIKVDLSVDVMAARGMPSGMVSGLMNVNGSSNAGTGAAHMRKCGDVDSLPAADKMLVVKIQVPMDMPGMMNPTAGLMLCYNQKRDVHCQIASENCDGGQRAAARLAHIVRSGRVAEGMKGYFNAYITNNKLRILAHKPLGLQPW